MFMNPKNPVGTSISRGAKSPFRLLVGLNDRVEGAAGILAGARRFAEKRGWKWTALGTLPLMKIAPHYDGIVAALYTGHGLETDKLTLPIVSVHPDAPPPRSGQVMHDESAAVSKVVDHFAGQGIQKVFLFENLDPNSGPHLRRGGLAREALQSRNLFGGSFPHGPRTIQHGWSMALQLEDLSDWLKGLPRGCGILATDDNHAKRVVLGAQLAGLSVPDDFILLGMGNHSSDCLSVSPGISSLSYNSERVGYQAAALVDRMRRGEPPERLRIPPDQIMHRESSTPWKTRHPGLREVLRMMRDHPDADLRLEDLAALAHTNRASLFQWFRQELDTTPHRKLKAYRLEKGRELLASTDLPLKEIPERCGYLHLSHFCRDFKKFTGQTPSEFRKAKTLQASSREAATSKRDCMP